MQYVVNGVVFDDEDQARAYEKTLEKENKEKELERYKDAVVSRLRVFRLSSSAGYMEYLAIIVDGDEHYKYATAIAEDILGERYSIKDKNLLTNWILDEIKDDDTGVLASIISSVVYGDPLEVECTLFQGVNLECPSSSHNKQAQQTCDSATKEMCDFLSAILGLTGV